MNIVQLHARVLPPPASAHAAPVILLHGLFGSWENLGSLARGLSGSRVVHALDLRNHGRSPHVASMRYSCMASDVLGYMDAHGLDQAHVIGHSMGGKCAMQLALDAPERVLSVISLDIAPVRYPPGHDEILRGLNALPLKEMTSRQEADRFLAPYVPEVPVRQFLLKNLVKCASGGFEWRMNLNAITTHYDEIRDAPEGEGPYLGSVLFVKGGASDYIQRSHQHVIERLFPRATLRVIPNTGHWLHAEKPETCLTVCQRFLDGKLR